MNEPDKNNRSMMTNPRGPWTVISTIVVIVFVLAILVVVYFRYFVKNNPISDFVRSDNPKTIEKNVNNLDGTLVESSLAKRHPLAVIVENHPQARPQSGLDKASIIYEAISEGGITRFLAIYGPYDAEKVGPVRSARTYFIDWVSEFNAYFSHVGGNLDALDKIKTDNIYDLDQFGLGESTYWRQSDPTKAIEHTMYTKTSLLYSAASKKGWPTSTNFQALNFRSPKPTVNGSQSITIDFSEPQYKVTWDYNPQTNTYQRTMAGVPHRDAETGDRLAASNIIIQEVERWEAITSINEQGFAMKTIGNGKAKFYIDGKEINGTWKKTSRLDRTIFFDSQGEEITFIPGTTWVEITPPEVFKTLKVV